MRQRSIVIRVQQNASFDHTGAAPTIFNEEDVTPPLLPIVEEEEFTPAEAARASRHSDVMAVAPELPTVLIEPLEDVENEFVSEAQAETSTWGIDAVGASSSPLEGAGIVPAILDTGIDADHPAFDGVHLDQRDFSGGGNGDSNGHGTHCAGTVFGQDVDGKRIGVARNIDRAIIGKVLGNNGQGNTIWSLKAIQWALNSGANIISMSLGIDFPGFVRKLENAGLPTELAVNRALEGYRSTIVAYQSLASFARSQSAFGNSCVIIAAAGNESRRHENPDWELAASLPSATPGILSIGAVGQTRNGLRTAGFSNTGVNISAPGVGILSARAGGSGLRPMNGTSMATPHVSGVACLWAEWLQSRGQLSPFNIEAKLTAHASTDSLAAGFDPSAVGLGVVQAPQTT